jgi:hypothetical protein
LTAIMVVITRVVAVAGGQVMDQQRGRDFQVTAGEDLSGWQAALGHQADVTIRVYDAGNHLFFQGTARPPPWNTRHRSASTRHSSPTSPGG